VTPGTLFKLEIVFVRHGEGEHMLDLPRSLELLHPALTARGRAQVAALRPSLALAGEELILASPTRRTIESALVIAEGRPVLATPRVGPRIFPPPRPGAVPLPCDTLLDPEAIQRDHPGVAVLPIDDAELWREGINTVADARFAAVAGELVAWCRASPRALIVTHDGTIHSYRQLLGEERLTRDSFVGPAGVHRMTV
jgi:broad specificity phosphatase PhoE